MLFAKASLMAAMVVVATPSGRSGSGAPNRSARPLSPAGNSVQFEPRPGVANANNDTRDPRSTSTNSRPIFSGRPGNFSRACSPGAVIAGRPDAISRRQSA